MLQDIYKILELPEDVQKQLNEAFQEIVSYNLFADVVNGLSEEQKTDLKGRLGQVEDKEKALKEWFEEHEVDADIVKKAIKSAEDSSVKFIQSIIAGVSEEKKSQVLDYLKTIKNG